MKNIFTILFTFSILFLFGQENLKDIDTTLDYKKRFFNNDELIAPNNYMYINSSSYYTINQITSDPTIDTTILEKVEHGLWIQYFDKKRNASDSSNYYYYRLGEYDFGSVTGKIYYFKKNDEIVRFALQYPKIKDSIYNGVVEVKFKKEKITWIEYQYFDEDKDSKKEPYLNLTKYYSNGEIKGYALTDNYNYKHEARKYNKKGLCFYELIIDKKGSYKIKRKQKGRKEIIEIHENEKLMVMK
jgi:hypothetical protein